MSLRVVVTGSRGRLGAAVVRRLLNQPNCFRVVAFDRKAVDLTNPFQIEDHLRAIRFDALINCAALTSLEMCEENPETARQINALAPQQMAEICRDRQARMIHVSTDYVYDGSHAGLRCEGDPIRPLGIYAATKAEGETLVRTTLPESVVARVSWIFGPDRPSFVDQILTSARKGSALAAIDDKFSAPSYSADLADSLAAVLARPEIRETLNICNSGCASWFTLAETALALAEELGISLKQRRLDAQHLADMAAFKSPRPVHTAMNNERFVAATGVALRPWQEALRDYLQTFWVPSGPH